MGGRLQAKYLVPCCCIRDSRKLGMQHDHVLINKKWNFDLLRPSRGLWEGEYRGLQAKYFVSFCCICESLKFEMQHDRVLKKWNFDLLTRSPGAGKAVCWQNIWYRVAAFVNLLKGYVHKGFFWPPYEVKI